MRRRACALLWGAAMTMAGCAGLPVDPGRSPSIAITGGADSPIGRVLGPQAAAHPGLSGVRPLPDGHGAFAARVALARASTRSLDVQVYIWHGDATGWLMFDEARRAADRGVRVRLLIDDNNTRGLDGVLAMLDAHPNLEVRLFNPFAQRGALRVLGYATDFARLNRRMHNKSFTADGLLTIVGGRNIGDEYFEAGQEASFADLDLLVAGAVVPDVSRSFDRYWNSESAFTAASVLRGAEPMTPEAFAARVAEISGSPGAAVYGRAVAASTLVQDALAGRLEFEWTRTRLVADDPEKVAEPPGTKRVQMGPRLAEALGTPKRELDLVSPYFVPGDDGTDALAALARSGVRVRVLTNSLAATDVGAVHAGYAKRRPALLRGGVELLELKPDAASEGEAQAKLRQRRQQKDGRDDAPQGWGGSSRASLHAKTFGIDRERLFVGSFNLDPRSAQLNTEMGLLVDSPTLATRLAEGLDRVYPTIAWRVELDGADAVRWRYGEAEPLKSEPMTGALRRLGVRVMSWLPIEWLL
jgi:putative cardiolipin synthase